MGRNYSQTTIKTLFAEARICAFPDCHALLIFRDRGAVTAVADIAHIRSESPSGPRRDPTYMGDLNGPENLLLLCGTHHRPVDRHESLYSIDELLSWKARQMAKAGAGTEVSDADIRAYERLSTEERTALAQVARLAERLTDLCERAQAEIDRTRSLNEQARVQAASSFGPIWEVDEDGNRSPKPLSTDSFQLPNIEQDLWDQEIHDTIGRHSELLQEAASALKEELAVLRMQSSGLRPWLTALASCSDELVRVVGNPAKVDSVRKALARSAARVWSVANGESEPPTT